MSFRIHRFATTLTLMAALAGEGSARAEAFDPPDAPQTVRIGSGSLEPAKLELTGTRRLVFENDSAAMARVEFDLARGRGIACVSGGDALAPGRKFVVATGARLECDAPAEAVAYRVFQNGGGTVAELRGRIEP